MAHRDPSFLNPIFGYESEALRKDAVCHRWTAMESYRATLAREITTQYALIAGLPDGEDSAGRARVRRATPAESVAFGCEMADLLAGEFAARGWFHQIPEPKERPPRKTPPMDTSDT